MRGKIVQGPGYALLPGAKTLVTISKKSNATSEKGVKPKEYSSTEWSPWGDDNLFPQNVLADIEKNSVTWRALEKRKTVHYGRGIIAYREMEEKDKDGFPKREIVKDQEILDFFRLNRINAQWIDLIGGLEIFANTWTEFILNRERNRINRVFVKDPAYCRLAWMNDSCKIPKLFYSAQWDYSPSLQGETIVPIPMYDPEKWDGKKYPDPNFVTTVAYRSFNKSYYNLAVWNGIRESGWLDIANKVPAMKLAIMKNQMVIKYHVTIPDYYFDKKYPDKDYTAAAKATKIKKDLEDLNEFLTDVENSGKAFLSWAYWSRADQKLMDSWTIKPIENHLDDGAYLPDSMAANSEILFGIGVDPCLIGAGIPGGKLGAGSGSDKREAFWQLNAEMGIYRQVSLEPLYFIRDFNGWDQKIQFDYAVVDTSQTQNQHPSKINKNIDETQTE